MPTKQSITRTLLLTLLAFSFSLALAGCQRASQQNNSAPASGVVMTFAVDPDPTRVGLTQAVVTLTGADDEPVTGATVALKGDMTHAGMQPVLADATEEAPGSYRAEFAWTMSGDWIVTVTVTLPSGAVAEQQFDLSVTR